MCPTIRELLALRAPLEASNSIGDTPLHCAGDTPDHAHVHRSDSDSAVVAVKAGSSPVVSMLVEFGADINAPNHKEETPMTVATSRGLGAMSVS